MEFFYRIALHLDVYVMNVVFEIQMSFLKLFSFH